MAAAKLLVSNGDAILGHSMTDCVKAFRMQFLNNSDSHLLISAGGIRPWSRVPYVAFPNVH